MNLIKLQNRIDTICMNSEPHRLLLNHTDKIYLKRNDKYVALSSLSMYYTRQNTRKSYKNKKLKLSAPKFNENFELPGGSYFVSDIPDYFKYIIKET